MLDNAEFNTIIEIVRTCVNSNRADLIEDALFDCKTAAEVREMIGATIESESPSRPATARAAAASSGGPSPAEKDGLRAAVRERMTAMYPPRSQ